MKNKTIYVTSCYDCPFREYYREQGGSFYECTQIPGWAGVIEDFDKLKDNCPLNMVKLQLQ